VNDAAPFFASARATQRTGQYSSNSADFCKFNNLPLRRISFLQSTAFSPPVPPNAPSSILRTTGHTARDAPTRVISLPSGTLSHSVRGLSPRPLSCTYEQGAVSVVTPPKGRAWMADLEWGKVRARMWRGEEETTCLLECDFRNKIFVEKKTSGWPQHQLLAKVTCSSCSSPHHHAWASSFKEDVTAF